MIFRIRFKRWKTASLNPVDTGPRHFSLSVSLPTKLVSLGLLAFLAFACATIFAQAPATSPTQDARLNLSNLDGMAEKATQTVDVTLNENMIRLAAKFLSNTRSPDEAKLREIVSKLKGIYVRSFEFDKEGQYSRDDIRPVLEQLKGSLWSQIVGVVSKKDHRDVHVYLMKVGDSVEGLAIVVVEPKEVTVVNIVGPIDIEAISELEGSFGIPKLGLEPHKPSK